ncbi:unknown [Clostridium sp. CAG:628]|nr:unknown [Clostridium sp. CAG:628]
MSNLKKYNIFTFVTTFAKLLIEVFIPLILYNMNFTIKEIILFLIIKHALCTIFLPITKLIIKKKSTTFLMIISSILFTLSYIYLNFLTKNLFKLLIFTTLLSMYLTFYWVGRHTYALSIIEDKKATDNVSIYTIFTILGGLFSTYIGSILIEKTSYLFLSIIVLFLMLISIIPLTKIKSKKETNEIKLITIITSFPKRNYIFTFLDQLRFVLVTIFPLYIYLNINKSYKYIGIINIVSGLGSIIYIYILKKLMDKNKSDYLSSSLLYLAITYTLKLLTKNNIIFLIIVFFEGIFRSVVDLITLRNTYVYSKNYTRLNYTIFTEGINNIGRVIILTLFYITNISLEKIILICILGILINIFIKYDDGKYGYNNVK